MSLPDFKKLTDNAAQAESEIKYLKEEIDFLRKCIETSDAGHTVSKEEYIKLEQENVKLKHRVAILKRTIEADRAKALEQNLNTSDEYNSKTSAMVSIYNNLFNLFEKAIKTAYPNIIDPPVVISSSNNPKFGDYQCNSAMPIAKQLSTQGIKIAPHEIARSIISNLDHSPSVSKVDIAGAGFINVYIDRTFVKNVLSNVLKSGAVSPPYLKKQRVIVDFSSPNIAKEMHVGHLRSTILGDSISRLLEYLGYDVLRINHIGDWGTQFGMLIAHLQDKFPDYLTVAPSITDLQTLYKESKIRFDSDEDFKKRAYECVVKLQAFEPNMTKAWQLICDVSRKEFQKVYDRLNVKLIERGESFYQQRMKDIVKELDARGFLEEDDGRKIMWGEKTGSGIPLTVVKSDGGFTYDTSDIAALKQRVEEERADWLIYITDAGQATHFQTLKSCAKRAGLLKDHHRMDHVEFGVVLGQDRKKFKTRSGDTVKLCDLLDEGLSRALQKLKEKQRDKVLSEDELKAAQESIAYGCIKYADLSHNRNLEYVFSFDKMLEDKGNTAVYLLYALTRIRSIARMANVSPEEVKQLAQTTSPSLEHEKEWKLAKVLVKFSDVLIRVTKDLYLHPLCEYCYEIACAFSEFYDNCYCVERNNVGEVTKVNSGRILLTEATAIILEQCFSLLGLQPVSRM